MPTLTLGQGLRVTYEDAGQGPAIVLIHGSPGMARNWEPVARRLAGRYPVLAPHPPGHGGSGAGPSCGGNVALAVALRGEVPVVGLVLLEPVLVRVLPAVGRDADYAEVKRVFDA